MKTRQTTSGVELLINNPALPPLAGERTRNMKKKKKTGGKKKNSASVNSNQPAANKRAPKQNQSLVKSTKKKTGGHKHNGWLPNFSGGKIGGLGIMDVVGAGGGVVLGEAGAAVLPQSYIGDGLLLLAAVLVAKGLSSFSITRPVSGGAGIGVGAVAVKNGLNRLTNGGVTNFFTGITNSARGYLQPVPQSQTQNGNGAGVGRIYQFR